MQEGSVVWMGWGRDIVLLGSMPHSWGSWALTQTPCKRNHGSGRFLLALSCDTLGKGDAGKVKLFLLPSPVRPNLYFWLQWYAGNLDLHKGSLVHGWLCKTVFSRGFWTMAKRGWSWFMGHCKVHRQDQGLLLITWCMDRWGASKVPWHMVPLQEHPCVPGRDRGARLWGGKNGVSLQSGGRGRPRACAEMCLSVSSAVYLRSWICRQ